MPKARRPRRGRRERGQSRLNRATQGANQRAGTSPRVQDVPRQWGERGSLGEPKSWVRLKSGEYELAARNLYRRPLRWKGAVVNPDLRLGDPPFEGIDEERCRVCGEEIKQWRAGISWDDGEELIRTASKSQDVAGGGWRTRGPVLWAMHYLKVKAWWDRHSMGGCRWLWDTYDGGRPIPRALSWACFYGGPDTAGGDCFTFNQVKALVDMGRPKPDLWPGNIQALAGSITWDVRPDDRQLYEMNKTPLTAWQRAEYADGLALTPDQVEELLAVAPLVEAEHDRPTLEDFIAKRDELEELGVTPDELMAAERAELASAWGDELDMPF